MRWGRPPLAVATAVALVVVSGASAELINGYTATGGPTHVKPLTLTQYTIAMTNTSVDKTADHASIGIPSGFVVLPTVQATATCGSPAWTVELPVPSLDGKINVMRQGGSGGNLCPGGTLTVIFSATSPAAEGTYEWATQLLKGDQDQFVLSGNQPSVQVDGTAPVVTLTSYPANPSNVTSPSFTFSANEAATFQCKLDAGAFAACSSPNGYTNLADGSHTFTVEAMDATGNTGETTYGWLIETTLPIATLTDKPSQASDTSVASFSFTASKPATFECKLDGGAFEVCTSPTSYTNLADGAHTFALRATDAANNTGPETSYAWTVDTVSPVATITTKPSDPSNDPSPTFEFSASEAVTFTCKLDGGAFASCTSPKAYSPGNGPHTFTVKATDAAGNTGQASSSWTVDTVPPTATITNKPTNPSNNPSPTFAFSASEEATFQCKLDAAPFTVCASPQSYTPGDGSHVFTVKATDAAGNSGEASYDWTIDTVAPTTAITKKPSNPSGVNSAAFEFSANEGGATFKCELDEGGFATCTSPKIYNNLPDGLHAFSVRATDAAGNIGKAESHTWLVETVLPVVTLTDKPKPTSNTPSASFFFTVNKPASIECKLDDAVFATCTSPTSYTNLLDGTHSFTVKATNAAGTGPPTVYAWTIDTTGPTSAITQRPSDPTNSRSATFAFDASEPANFQCKLDGEAFAACPSPYVYSDLGDGRHTFVVKATDAVLNTGPETAYAWTIELRAPAVAVTSAPRALGTSRIASFSFTADEPSAFQCNLDGRGFEPCSSPASYGGLSDGAHGFAVRATDAAGNLGAASYAWTIDATPPQTALDAKPQARTTSTSAMLRFSANEPTTFQCRLDGRSFSACSSPKRYAGLARGLHRFAVRAIDAAGNVDSTPSLSQWTVGRGITRTVAGSALLAPAAGSRVTRPPLLRWRKAPRASYYNVQLFRAGRKVLTAWPTRPALQLRARWKLNGQVQRFESGVYRWYVWPGYGRPAARRYGPVLGTSTFVVGRAPRRR